MRVNKVLAYFLIFVCSILLCSCSNHEHTKSKEISGQDKYIHISFDDTAQCISNLANKDYDSVWEEPFLSWLKSLHETYNARFSLYCFLDENFDIISDKYKDELFDTSDWLKFGLHAETSDGKYVDSTYQDGLDDWNWFCSKIIKMTGNENSIDRIPRLHYFGATYEVLCGMRDADYGAIGFLSADDDRQSYYLNEDQNKYLLDNDYIYDIETKLYFYGTDMRGDWFGKGFSSSNKYDIPTQKDGYSV